ncbi:uncharacterized protein LOC143259578 isoform X2 [Megalopta genalis]|uniref:uncharacterized protein LOC143259578 isoform X2 n=1 Tax=Megalopta genalis TaxID=115081 RepID=UPI003FD53D24
MKLDATTNSLCRHQSTLTKMDEFRKNYALYSTLLGITALWPYDESLSAKIQRVSFPLLILSLIMIQISKLRSVEISLSNAVTMLSLSCPMFLFFLRYVGFVINLPITREVFDMIGNDWKATKNPIEIDIFMKHMAMARRVIVAFLGVSCVLMAYVTVVILVPTLLRSKRQLYYLHMFGFFFHEGGHIADCVCLQFIIVASLGLLSISSTESVLAVFSAYLCGLLEIASYRIETAICNVVHSASSEIIEVQSAVDMHKRALKTLSDMIDKLMISYLIAIIGVILSFAVNLYRLLLAIKSADDFENIFFSANDVLLHFIIMFLNNYIGQRLTNTSMKIFEKISNSLWYCISPRSQKVLLFILLRSVKEVRCNLAGLYDLCYEGFSMMMSSSFSYFTVLYSTQ